MTEKLSDCLPCPFCGGPAMLEEIKMGDVSNYSVGCNAPDEASCMGYQSVQQFARKCEAIAAWNRRPATPPADAVREKVAAVFDGWLVQFGDIEITHVSARDYAVDAVKDIQEHILALLHPQGGEGEVEGGRPSSAHLAVSVKTTPEVQRALDQAWRAVDVLGAPDTACRTDEERAYCRAIGDACAEIEKLGGRWS